VTETLLNSVFYKTTKLQGANTNVIDDASNVVAKFVNLWTKIICTAKLLDLTAAKLQLSTVFDFRRSV